MLELAAMAAAPFNTSRRPGEVGVMVVPPCSGAAETAGRMALATDQVKVGRANRR
jgi:hypothetical protein